jgi:hypothetical protein
MLYNILSRIVIIFSLIGVGFILDKRRVVSREALQSLSTVVINVMMPALIFSSIVTQFSRDAILAGYALPLLGILTFGAGACIGWILVKVLKVREKQSKNTVIYLLTINNYGYLTLPIVFMLFGESGVALLFLHNLGCHLVFWTFGVWLLAGGDFSLKSIKPLFNVPFVSLVISLCIPFLGLESLVPKLFVEICDTLGRGAIPLIMLVIGSTLAEIEFKQGLFEKNMVWLTVCRLAAVPLIVILLLKMFHLPDIYRNIAVIVAVMPVASSTPLFTKQYGGDTPLAAKSVFVTTLASAVTIPFFLMLFLK